MTTSPAAAAIAETTIDLPALANCDRLLERLVDVDRCSRASAAVVSASSAQASAGDSETSSPSIELVDVDDVTPVPTPVVSDAPTSSPCPSYSIDDVGADPTGDWDDDGTANATEFYDLRDPCTADAPDAIPAVQTPTPEPTVAASAGPPVATSAAPVPDPAPVATPAATPAAPVNPCPNYSIDDVFAAPDLDWDGDRVSNVIEFNNLLNPCVATADAADSVDIASVDITASGPCPDYTVQAVFDDPDGDWDRDLVPNLREFDNQMDPCSFSATALSELGAADEGPTEGPCPDYTVDDLFASQGDDWDGDGVSNGVEFDRSTNPCEAESDTAQAAAPVADASGPCPGYSVDELFADVDGDWDDDGELNGAEFDAGTDPCQAEVEFASATPTPTTSATPTATPSPTPTATPEPTATPSPTPTATPEPTATASPTPTATPESTATASPTPTATPEPTATAEATATPEPTATPEATATAEPDTGTSGASPDPEIVAPIDSGSAVYLAPTGSWAHTLRVVGSNIELTSAGGTEVVPVASAASIVILGSPGNDVITIDLSGGAFPIPISFDAGDGDDTLVGPTPNTDWRVDGPGSGHVVGVSFTGVDYLQGAADNEDTFVFGQNGAISGHIHGGDRGFDSLVTEGSYGVVDNLPTSPDAGSVILDGNEIVYVGLEPIALAYSDVVNFDLGALGVAEAELRPFAADLTRIELAGAGFEDHNFLAPATSLTIIGGPMIDTVTLTGALNLGTAKLTVESEKINVAATAIVQAADVTLAAIDSDAATVTTAGAVADRSAEITIAGQIDATGSLDISATASRDIAINDLSGTPVALAGSTEASVEVLAGASLSGAAVTLSALTDGSVSATGLGDVSSTFADSATVALTDAVVTGDSVTISATTDVDYAATGDSATNEITGAASAVVDGGSLTSTTGDVSVTALDQATLQAIAGDRAIDLSLITLATLDVELAAASAQNILDRTIEARLVDAVTDSADSVVVQATGTAMLEADAVADSVTGSNALLVNLASDIGGTLSANALLGGVAAAIDGGSVDAINDITVDATHNATLLADVSGNVSTDATSITFGAANASLGGSISFNLIGWEVGSLFTQTIDALIGTDLLSTARRYDVSASIDDSDISAGENVAVTATSTSTIDAVVTNEIEGAATSLYGAMGISGGASITRNRINMAIDAFISSPTAGRALTATGGVQVLALDASAITAATTMAATSSSGSYLGISLSDSDSVALGGSVSLNDISNPTTALVQGMDITTSGAVVVLADQTATVTSDLASEAASSGGSIFGDGTSLAASGLISTNAIRGASDAALVATDIVSAASLAVTARANRMVDAALRNLVSSGAQGIGVTLAFNTVGWDPQNILFNAVDALIGDPLIANAFGDDQGAGATASITDSTASVTGSLQLMADSSDDVTAMVTNMVDTTSTVPFGTASGLSLGAMVSMNKVSAGAAAEVSYATAPNPADPARLIAGGAILVEGQDTSTVNATVVSEANTVAEANDFVEADAKGYSFVVSLNDVRGGTDATVTNASIDAGANLGVHAAEVSDITAETSVASETSTSGGTILSGTTTSGLAALVATNVVQGAVNAELTNSDVAAASVSVTAANESTLDSKTVNATVSGGNGIGVSAAFNSIGWDSQNILFNAVEAIIGSLEISGAFGADGRSNATATVLDTTIDATGNVVVDADAAATLTSLVTNDVEIDASSTLTAAEGLSVGVAIALNKISSSATALLGFTTTGIVDAGGAVAVTATDAAVLDATILLDAVTSAAADAVVGSAEAKGFGFAIALNDVRGGANASIDNADVTGATVTITADQSASITAQNDVTAETSASAGLGIIGSGTSTMTVTGVVATNTVMGGALAGATGSDLTATGGGVIVQANLDQAVEAGAINAVEGGSQGIGVTLAFNSIGWTPQNVLFNTLDALIQSPEISGAFDGDGQSESTAQLLNTTVSATGALLVAAASAATVRAEIDNRTSNSASSDLKTAKGLSFGAVLASNKVSSGATATIDFTDALGPADPARIVAGSVMVSASDTASIDATVTLESVNTAEVNNLRTAEAAGYSIVVTLNEVQGNTTASITDASLDVTGAVTVTATEASTISANTSVAAESSTSGGTLLGGTTTTAVTVQVSTNVVQGSALATVQDSDVTAGSLIVGATNDSTLDAQTVNATRSGGDAIGVTASFNSIGWDSQNILFNTVEVLIGSPEVSDAFGADGRSNAVATVLDTTVDIGGPLEVAADASADLTALVTNDVEVDASSDLTAAEGLSVGVSVAMNKVSSGAAASLGFATTGTINAGGVLEVTASDTATIDAAVELDATTSAGANETVGSAQAHGFAFAIALNDVRGGADATINNADVTASSVLVSASQTGAITSQTDVAAATSASAGLAVIGSGTSTMTITGIIATNAVIGGATATVTDSSLTTTVGNVAIDASVQQTVTSGVINAVEGGSQGIAITLSFNSIGWAPQNVLFNAIDALIQSPEISNAFGDDGESDATASLLNTTVSATGSLLVSAAAAATVESEIDNKTSTSASSTLKSAKGYSFGAVLASNKVSSGATATIDFTTPFDPAAPTARISAGAGVTVQASDTAAITASIVLAALNDATVNDFNSADSKGFGFAIALNDVRGDTAATISDASVSAGGAISVTATESSVVTSTTNVAAETSTSGGTLFKGTDALSVTGILATNVIQGAASALVSESDLTGSSDATISASNTSNLTATSDNAALSGGMAIGATLAFNSIGWTPANLLFNLIDTMIGSPEILQAVGDDEGSQVSALLHDTSVDIDGQLTVSADASVTVDSKVENRPTAEASSVFTNAEGFSLGIVVAQNKIASDAIAAVTFDDAANVTIDADGGVAVTANNTMILDAVVSLESNATADNNKFTGTAGAKGFGIAVTLNDVRGDTSATVVDADIAAGAPVTVRAMQHATITAVTDVAAKTSASGGKVFGGSSNLRVAAQAATNVLQGGATATVTGGSITTTGAGSDVAVSATVTSVLSSDVTTLNNGGGKGVSVTLSFNSIGWEPENLLFNTIDTIIGSTEIAEAFNGDNKSNAVAAMTDTRVLASGSLSVTADASASLTSLVTNQSVTTSSSTFKPVSGLSVGAVVAQNKVSSSASANIAFTTDWTAGDPTRITAGGVLVRARNTASFDATVALDSNTTATANEVQTADAKGFSFAVSLNEIRSGADAALTNATVEAPSGNVAVRAVDTSVMTATTTVVAEASTGGGQLFGNGTSATAAVGVAATNAMLGAVQAIVRDSAIVTTAATPTLTDGNVTVEAINDSTMTADVSSGVTSGGTAVGVTLAFNSLGWQNQNILFNTVDALLGDPLIADAFGADGRSDADAHVLNTTIDAVGEISVVAMAEASLTATTINEVVADSSSIFTDVEGASFGFLITSNKVSSAAHASIDFLYGGDDPVTGEAVLSAYTGATTITGDLGVTVSATDDASIIADIDLVAAASASNLNPFGDNSAKGIGAAVALNDVRGGATALIDDATVRTTTGGVTVSAVSSGLIDADLDAEALSSGGSIVGGQDSTSLAVNANIATNTVLGGAEARITDSDVRTITSVISASPPRIAPP